LSHVAESYVYQKDDGSGYVGRSLVGNGVLVGRRGFVFSDEDVAAWGLEDLKDHTDYDAVLAEAKAKGAPITVKAKDGSIVSVGGPDPSLIVQIPHPNAGRDGPYPKEGTMQNMTLDSKDEMVISEDDVASLSDLDEEGDAE